MIEITDDGYVCPCTRKHGGVTFRHIWKVKGNFYCDSAIPCLLTEEGLTLLYLNFDLKMYPDFVLGNSAINYTVIRK